MSKKQGSLPSWFLAEPDLICGDLEELLEEGVLPKMLPSDDPSPSSPPPPPSPEIDAPVHKGKGKGKKAPVKTDAKPKPALRPIPSKKIKLEAIPPPRSPSPQPSTSKCATRSSMKSTPQPLLYERLKARDAAITPASAKKSLKRARTPSPIEKPASPVDSEQDTNGSDDPSISQPGSPVPSSTQPFKAPPGFKIGHPSKRGKSGHPATKIEVLALVLLEFTVFLALLTLALFLLRTFPPSL
ncbi:hypothetical protein HYPSUDRAFT_56511 [Hypholoma sublateritium FD-334 SS-4]|uniref:Uncharacterized protein n=1 Tax=Hypholoma sublateritium (strain FD-334 SS-4) TaxID=945553 RepID=A0A0D2PHZ7_HYPSF|nr:hypothetical protein HYPSUDRAFT_56511 [Hypholoma sublateritium FD-334 SS-4]